VNGGRVESGRDFNGKLMELNFQGLGVLIVD
jgi:hypothetical protein